MAPSEAKIRSSQTSPGQVGVRNMFFVLGTQSPIYDHWARVWAGSHMRQEVAVGGVDTISKSPSCRPAAEETVWLSLLLLQPDTQGVCQSTPHFLLPRRYSPKCPPNRTYTLPSNGEAGRGKPLKLETWGWGWGEWIFPELVHLWPRARPAEKLCPPVTQQPHPTRPPRYGDRERWEAGTLTSASWLGSPERTRKQYPI